MKQARKRAWLNHDLLYDGNNGDGEEHCLVVIVWGGRRSDKGLSSSLD